MIDPGIIFLAVAALGFAADRAILSTTPAPAKRPMTAEQIEDWYDGQVLEAFRNNVTVTAVSGYDEEEEEEEAQENPAFDAWAKEQTKHIMASLTAAQRDTFIRTGSLPRGFSYTRTSPPCLLECQEP